MNHLKNFGLWLLFFIPALLIEVICYILAPLVALFVTSRPRTDVKRLGEVVNMPRDYIIRPLYWFQTHDNAVDEWWYGLYNVDHWFKFARNWMQADYDGPKETATKVWVVGDEDTGYWHQLQIFPLSFQFEMHLPQLPLRIIGLAGLLACAVFLSRSPLLAFLLGTINYVFYAFIEGRYLSINIGWKAHKETARLLYANRIIGFRKYK